MHQESMDMMYKYIYTQNYERGIPKTKLIKNVS